MCVCVIYTLYCPSGVWVLMPQLHTLMFHLIVMLCVCQVWAVDPGVHWARRNAITHQLNKSNNNSLPLFLLFFFLATTVNITHQADTQLDLLSSVTDLEEHSALMTSQLCFMLALVPSAHVVHRSVCVCVGGRWLGNYVDNAPVTLSFWLVRATARIGMGPGGLHFWWSSLL